MPQPSSRHSDYVSQSFVAVKPLSVRWRTLVWPSEVEVAIFAKVSVCVLVSCFSFCIFNFLLSVISFFTLLQPIMFLPYTPSLFPIISIHRKIKRVARPAAMSRESTSNWTQNNANEKNNIKVSCSYNGSYSCQSLNNIIINFLRFQGINYSTVVAQASVNNWCHGTFG